MIADIVHSIFNGVVVTLGLFALWSFVGGMKHQPASSRFQYAMFAGAVSALVMFVVRLFA